ncbi:putative tryptophan transport protein TrpP [Gottschalkia purinilytica]|uniref:Putative tryptophan transport protein TrpP n=1 Tax=Gottschalkia purinilytica TaxID=1503 RepID=A0A0L0WCN7_GOTPU|nr:tryptophan transporter [Gottschalkia purinilytica]KNF09232.1 putative tryptophan transport protein TrpP [Gottschalkia purinilytica]
MLRKNILSALLLALGFIIHQLTPAGFAGITFDIQLTVLFVIIAINMDFKNAIMTGIASGLITSLTTKTPGGHIPNFIDKIVTSILIYFIILLLFKVLNKQVSLVISGAIGTIISGSVFLGCLILLGGLPAKAFTAAFITAVLPTALVNCILTVIVYNAIVKSKKLLKADA